MIGASFLCAFLAFGSEPTAAGGGEDVKTCYKPGMFNTLVDPECSYCRDEAKRAAGALRDDDRVLAWIRGDHTGGAIPYRWFLVPYRVVSDTYGVFVYDPDADFVRAWPASLDFRFQGWRNGVMVMKHKDGTVFDCLTGLGVDGPRKGQRLKPIAAIESDWGPWLRDHPGTVAYQMVSKFNPMSIPNKVSAEALSTRPKLDERYNGEERVFGLTVGSDSKAWPLRNFSQGSAEIKQVKIGDEDAVILWDGPTRSAAAFASETEGKKVEKVMLKLDAGDPKAPWIDETGSRWSIVGRAVSGPRKGEVLRWLPGVMIKWHAWSAAYPKTTLEAK